MNTLRATLALSLSLLLATCAGPMGSPALAQGPTTMPSTYNDIQGNPHSVSPTYSINGGAVSGSAGVPLKTDSLGYLLPARGTPSTAITSLTASSATQIASALTTRIGETLITSAANSAPIYVCYIATTTCSATVYDDIIPINTAAGAHLTPLFGHTGTVYAYTTSTGVSIAFQSWSSQ